MNLFFYVLFFIDIVVGILLSIFINLTLGIITACVLLFINIITFIVILKIQKQTLKIKNDEKFSKE